MTLETYKGYDIYACTGAAGLPYRYEDYGASLTDDYESGQKANGATVDECKKSIDEYLADQE